MMDTERNDCVQQQDGADRLADAFLSGRVSSVSDAEMQDSQYVDVCYSPLLRKGVGLHEVCLESFCAYKMDANTVMPNHALASFLGLANVGSDAFVAALRQCDRDPTDFRRYLDAVAAPRSAIWSSFRVDADPSKSPLLSADDVIAVLDAAKEGGLPVLVFRCRLKDFVDLPWDESDAQVAVASQCGAPHIGAHDFMGGVGHLVKVASQGVVVPLVKGAWFSDAKRYRSGVVKSHGFESSSLMVGLTPIV